MREVNPYRRQLRSALARLGPGRQCGGAGRCPYFLMGVAQSNCHASAVDKALTNLIDEKQWNKWESFELLDLIDHLDGPVDFLVEP